ncbi:hypothetical protein ACRRTK_003372 [Alexandromys fortis]
MQTRLPRALAALGVALLLSSIEAEEKSPPSEVCPFPDFQIRLCCSASPSLYSAVWSLCWSAVCCPHCPRRCCLP